MRTQREQTKWDKRQKGRDWKTSHCMPTNSDQGPWSVPSSDLSLLDSEWNQETKLKVLPVANAFPQPACSHW